MEDRDVTFNQIQESIVKYLLPIDTQTDFTYISHFEFKDPVNATYIITFWVQWPCISKISKMLDEYGIQDNFFEKFFFTLTYQHRSHQILKIRVAETYCHWWRGPNYSAVFKHFKKNTNNITGVKVLYLMPIVHMANCENWKEALSIFYFFLSILSYDDYRRCLPKTYVNPKVYCNYSRVLLQPQILNVNYHVKCSSDKSQ